jgi:CheY-like chemotaxis protein
MAVEPESAQGIVVGVDDMFFAAKITGAADALGAAITRVKSADELTAHVERHGASLIIIDLNSSRLDPIPTIRHLKSKPELKSIPVIGFVSHVQVDLMNEAQQAGCDHVMPRSAFSKRLPELLSKAGEQCDKLG